MGLIGIWPDTRWFIFVYGLAWLSQGVFVAAQTSILQHAYRDAQRGRLFGLAISAMTLSRLLATVAAGWLLDWREDVYGLVYLGAGAAACAGSWLMTRMERASDIWPAGAATMHATAPAVPEVVAGEVRPRPATEAPAGSQSRYRPATRPSLRAGLHSMRDSIALVTRILREDHRFRRFERNFFIYGIAFLSLLPVVPLFLVHDLGLDYRQIGLAKGLMGQAGMLLFPPLLGRMLERIKPVRFSTRVFAFLGLFPALLICAGLVPGLLRLPLVFAAFTAWGIGMSGVALAWHLSSIEFAGEEDSSAYQSVHLVLTGVRGGFAPLLGFGVIQLGSNLYGFMMSCALFLTAALLMHRMARAERRGSQGAARSLGEDPSRGPHAGRDDGQGVS
ncbi:MAG: hypothetical protein GF330_11240 [Candidatus Eisenbacteria bacterium]|nr:hypothetical protein [Candidatus Eisenbacteria bacterium]